MRKAQQQNQQHRVPVHSNESIPRDNRPPIKTFNGKTSSANSEHLTVTFANGDRYEGTMRDGKKHGRGKYIWANGDVYTGDFIKDEKSGLGKLQYSNGDVFEGYRRNDKKNGQGKYTFLNGCTYSGNYIDDCFHGIGMFRSNQGWTYEGEWVKNEAHGQGKLTYQNGDVFVGGFKEDMRNGTGCIVYADGSKYEGEFVNDEKCGQGKITHADGSVHEGEFKGDIFLRPTVPDSEYDSSVDALKLPAEKKSAVLKTRRSAELATPIHSRTIDDVLKKIESSFTGSINGQFSTTAEAILLLSRSCVDQCLFAAIQNVAPSPDVSGCINIDSERKGERDEEGVTQIVGESEDGFAAEGMEEHNVQEDMAEKNADSTSSNQCPLPPSESTRSVKLSRPVHNPLSSSVVPAPESNHGDLAMDTQISDLFHILKDLGDLDSRSDEGDAKDLTDEEKASKYFPRKGKKHYDDIKMGKAMTKLLGDKSKLQKYLKSENEYLPSSSSTVELIKKIRRELNLPGDKGPDPRSQSISSDLEKELVDEDIAYVDEMAIDYNSFIMENKEASATWSGVEIPRLGSSVFRNLANESSILKNDPFADSAIVQSAVMAAGVKSPIKNDWMDIFEGAPPTAKMRREEKRLRELALHKKSPYYQTAKLAGKTVATSKSNDSFLKVGNPCSASNMRSRKLGSIGGTALTTVALPLPNRSDGTPTMQSTMKIKSKSKNTPFYTFELLVPKTKNGLQVQFAQSSTSKIRKSLVVKALSPDSNVFKQGILKVDDEILEVNSVPVKGKFVDDITGIIACDSDSFILVLVRRSKSIRKQSAPTDL